MHMTTFCCIHKLCHGVMVLTSCEPEWRSAEMPSHLPTADGLHLYRLQVAQWIRYHADMQTTSSIPVSTMMSVGNHRMCSHDSVWLPHCFSTPPPPFPLTPMPPVPHPLTDSVLLCRGGAVHAASHRHDQPCHTARQAQHAAAQKQC